MRRDSRGSQHRKGEGDYRERPQEQLHRAKERGGEAGRGRERKALGHARAHGSLHKSERQASFPDGAAGRRNSEGFRAPHTQGFHLEFTLRAYSQGRQDNTGGTQLCPEGRRHRRAAHEVVDLLSITNEDKISIFKTDFIISSLYPTTKECCWKMESQIHCVSQGFLQKSCAGKDPLSASMNLR